MVQTPIPPKMIAEHGDVGPVTMEEIATYVNEWWEDDEWWRRTETPM